MIDAYYSIKKGKRYQKGWRAKPTVKGQIIEQKLFALKEKTKAQLWHDRIVSLAKKGYDFGFTLNDAFKLYLDDFSGTINGKLYANKAYKCVQKNASEWLNKLVGELKPSDISQLLRELDKSCADSLGRKRSHLKREVEILHAAFEHYRDEKNIDFTVIRKNFAANSPLHIATQRSRDQSQYHPISKVIHREGENILVG